MKKFKIHLSLYQKSLTVAGCSALPPYNPRGIPQENFFPTFSIYVRHKFNTV